MKLRFLIFYVFGIQCNYTPKVYIFNQLHSNVLTMVDIFLPQCATYGRPVPCVQSTHTENVCLLTLKK